MPHVALDFLVFNFQIGNCSAQFWIPVNQSLSAVNQIFLIETDKHFQYCTGHSRIHGETFTGPVNGITESSHLSGDGAAGLFLPLPDFIDESFASVILTGFLFLCSNFSFHHHLGCNTGMVGTCLPQCIVTVHSSVADQRIHDGLLEGMTHVQTAGYIRRWQHDTVGWCIWIAVRLEISPGFPVLINFLFYGF